MAHALPMTSPSPAQLAQLKIWAGSATLDAMELEMTLPEEVPVMTLPNTAFFPQALMPLHIFEPRYRQMLSDVLAANRLFAVTGLDVRKLTDPLQFEPPHRIGTVGIIRACQKSEDGTSNLLLQGLCRVEILSILGDEPYRRIRMRVLSSAPGAAEDANQRLRRELSRLLKVRARLGEPGGGELTDFLKTIEDPEAFADIAAFSLCDDVGFKQKLLETLDVHHRLRLLGERLRLDIENLKLRRLLQGHLPDERIPEN
jgi:Lon protease-like protein